MAKSLTVKVATPKVIAALESKLAQMESIYANQEILEVEYQTQFKAYQDALIKYATDNLSRAFNFRVNNREWQKTVNLDFDVNVNSDNGTLPQCPERNYEQMSKHEYNQTKSEIQNALNILKMTDEEVVNASTMKSIAQYL